MAIREPLHRGAGYASLKVPNVLQPGVKRFDQLRLGLPAFLT